MIIVCPGCQARYKFDETKLGDRPKAKTRCSKCGGSIEIENPAFGASTLAPEPLPEPPAAPPPEEKTELTKRSQVVSPAVTAASDLGATITGKDLHKLGILELPKDRRFSLAVIQGAATGQIHPITKTRTTIGRLGNDINIDDPEASRQHAVVEIVGETAILRDLDSTNGTFVEVDRIEQQVLTNQMEFRIGSHVIMFIVTEIE
ncbi:MAG TPA: FHA domain-containing protein [Vicinamibacteria bacterium]|nr:FHA domain-containing protein [Vicinamibacteria bacterium]